MIKPLLRGLGGMALAFGLMFAPLSPAAAQTITIDSDVTHDVFGNGDPTNNGSSAGVGGWPFANATGNTVNVNSGRTVDGNVHGGYAESLGNATASGNTADISGTVSAGQYVYGGLAYSSGGGTATANNNTTYIRNGTVNFAYGGYAESASNSATASGNTVDISGGTVTSRVFGGQADGATGTPSNATGNTVNISGNAVIGGAIYAGFSVTSAAGDGSATGNTINISGTPNLTAADLYGGFVGFFGSPRPGDARTGNTLNLKTSGLTVSSVQNFQYLNFYVPSTLAAGGTMMNVAYTADITGSTVRVGVDGGSSALDIGDTITLISAGTLTGAAALDGTRAQGIQGIANIYSFDLSVLGNDLNATAAEVGANEQVKALSEGRAAGLAFLNQGADLLMGPGLSNLLGATQSPGLASFGAMSGGSSRYKTGSHVDVNGVSLILGLGWRVPMEPSSGSLVAGAFFEAGWGNYNSYNSFNSASSVKGKGDSSYYGGGVLGRYEKPAGPGGIYGEASFRAGRVKTDFRSKDIMNSESDTTKYDSGSAYYGAHIGAGYVWRINDKSSLDFSTRYIWTHQAGDSVTISGDKIKFKDSDSQRWRSGVRFSHAVNEYVAPYAGAYYEHEFGGKVRATVNGDSIDAPSMRGSAGIGELGLSLTPSKDLPLFLDLGVQGYVGKREGVTGSLQIRFTF